MENLTDRGRQEIKDKELSADSNNEQLGKHDFVGLSAAKRKFNNVDFKYSTFTDCYMRDCQFSSCDFTGVTFKTSNFRGAEFTECTFLYATWEKTYLEDNFIDSAIPSQTNLARDIVRSLRVNYSQIGNYEGVNKASSKEVELTGSHLWKAVTGSETYYREKFKGFAKKFVVTASFTQWWLLDFLWGNGENPLRIARAILVVIATGSLWIYFFQLGDSKLSFADAIRDVVYVFWGVPGAPKMDIMLGTFLVLSRLLLFALFSAVVVKRLSRR